MISIIICSRQGEISDQLKLNINTTIGIPYELILIDNSRNEYSIFEAYNEGIKRAQNDFLCFMHEDILYHSCDWGKSVIKHLSDQRIGLIGLAGSFYLLPIPSSWGKAKPYTKNLIQLRPDKKGIKEYVLSENKEVVCVDGFWFCSRKEVFEKVSFDTNSYNGFHFYDLDISMQIHQKGYLILIPFDIKVEHQSEGSFDCQWLHSAYIFYNKWKEQLPASIKNPKVKKKPLSAIKAYRDLLYLHVKNNYPISKETLKIGWNRLGINVLTAFLLFYIKRIMKRK
jgi:GT2 family glycosyltransferase